jgi:hypothetical protein
VGEKSGDWGDRGENGMRPGGKRVRTRRGFSLRSPTLNFHFAWAINMGPGIPIWYKYELRINKNILEMPDIGDFRFQKHPNSGNGIYWSGQRKTRGSFPFH